MERAIDFYKAIPILSSVWNILTGVSSGAAKDGRARKRRMRGGKGYLGVWDPTGEELRERSGLPVERGAEEIRLRCLSPGEGLRELERGELGAALADGGCGVWIDFLRPRDEARGILAEDLSLGSLVVEDCLSPLRMPKMDTFEGGAFVAAFAARLEQEDGYRAHLRAVEVDLLVGENYLVTVRDGPVREIEDGLGRRLSKARDARRNEIHEGGPGERLDECC